MNAQTIWNHLISAGLSPEGAAGLMGNLRAESNLDPQNLQNSFEAKLNHTNASYTAAVDNGSYTAFATDSAGYGLAQWTHRDRKQRMLIYARTMCPGCSIGDLDMQLKFLCYELQGYYPGIWGALRNTSDVRYASDLVLTQYERPADQGEKQAEKRYAFSMEYYNTYAKEGEPMPTLSEQRDLAVHYMTSRKKKNDYTQGAKRDYFFGYPDNKPGNTTQAGYSDCSAAARKAIKAATGIDIGSNTSAQINNRNKKGIVVHETDGYYPDEDVLLPADCLYFKGNKSHPLDVGHVEMYIGNGKICGHGSGVGPKIQNMKDYCKSRANSKRRYFMTIRWIHGDEAAADPDVLKYGMNDNADVKLLQLNLIALGYDLGTYGADGDFGNATKSAVMAFQQNVGIDPTGIADANTLTVIAAALDAQGDDDDEEQIEVPVQDGVTIAAGTWNIRTGPSADFPVAGIAKSGEVYERAEIGNWIPIVYNGEVCFIGPSAVKK